MRCLLAGWAVACFSPGAYALDPHRAISQYIHREWSAEQGFPGGVVNAIAQTPDGYLWIGTENGLVRFDGQSFLLFNHANTTSFPDRPVLGLNTDAEGCLWIRLQGLGPLRYRGGTFQEVFPDEAPDSGVTAMGPGTGGDILLARPGDLVRFHGDKLLRIAPGMADASRLSISIAEASGGTVWMGTRDAGLFSIRDGQVSNIAGLRDRKINCILPGTASELWIGTDDGLSRWNGSQLLAQGGPAALLHRQVLALTRDRDGNVWAGTSGGIVRIDPHGVPSEDRAQGRPPRTVNAVFEDREGNLWAGGTHGIEQYRDSVFLSYSSVADQSSEHAGPLYIDAAERTWFAPPGGGLGWLKESEGGTVDKAGLSNDIVYSITGGPNELWIGRQRGGLTRLELAGDAFSVNTYTAADGLAPGSILAVHRTRDGSVWAGSLNGGVSRLHDGRITTYTTADGLASNAVSAIEDTADGTVWFATPNGLQSFAQNHWRLYASKEGLPPGRMNCLTEDSKGVLWIGTDAGLAFVRAGRVQTPHAPPPALIEEIFGIADDGRGYLWIATTRRVMRAPRDSLLGDVAGEWTVREFGLADGIPATEGIRRHRSVVRDHLGRIWFSLRLGISVVNPTRVATGMVPALVHIQSVTADGQPLDTRTGSLRIPADRQRITLGFIGVSLSVPERVKFRYRLDDFDRDWSEPSASREAVYTNLSHGSYRFRVIATNSEGVWTGSEAAVTLVIVPRFWQTWWFRGAIVAAIILAIVAIYRFRLYQMSARLHDRFEERLAERTRIAQELHDTLLQGFLSASMQVHVAVDRLPADSEVKPSLTRALQLMRQVIDEGRNAVRGLRSSSSPSLDLAHAFSLIQQELSELGTDSDQVKFRVIVDGPQRPLHPLLRDEVYRIGREALINAFRHSRAKRIELEIKYSASQLRVSVRDDGSGIDPKILQAGRDGHWGLSGMRERAEQIGARFHVFSSATAGTEIELSVPAKIAFESQPSGRLAWIRRKMRPRAGG